MGRGEGQHANVTVAAGRGIGGAEFALGTDASRRVADKDVTGVPRPHNAWPSAIKKPGVGNGVSAVAMTHGRGDGGEGGMWGEA